jgi:hypothetical protein
MLSYICAIHKINPIKITIYITAMKLKFLSLSEYTDNYGYLDTYSTALDNCHFTSWPEPGIKRTAL